MRHALAFFAALAALPAVAQAPAPGDLVVNEIMYDPPSGGSANEWVEVLNVTAAPLDVGGLAVADASATSAGVPAGTTLGPGAYLVLVRDGAAFAAAYPGVPFVELAGFPTLNNTGDRPALVLGGTEIDAVPFRPSWGGDDASLERIDPLGPSDSAANFGTSTAPGGGTPGAQNTLFATDDQPPTVVSAEALDATSVRVTFSEPVEAATAETAANYRIDGGVGPPVLADLQSDPAQVVLALGTALANGQSYTLTVQNVEDLRGNALTTETATFLFAQGEPAERRDLVVNEFLYDEPGTDNPGEFVELFNRSGKTFDLRDFTLNDGTGADEPITARAVFVPPGGYAVVVEDGALFAAVFPDVPFVEQAAWSALNNTGDAIVLKYQGTVVDSLRYAPDWGGEDASLERKDPDGPSSVAANWATTTDLRGGTPGAQNSQFMPDTVGPMLTGATASRDGRTVTVTLDEPADPATVTASAFAVGAVPVAAADYVPETTTVVLTLGAPLAAGESTVTAAVTASGLADLLGNVTDRSSTTVTFTPDVAFPALARATALSPTQIRATFTEPVTESSALDPAAYAVQGLGQTVAAADAEARQSGGVTGVLLTLSGPLAERTLYTLVATGLTDLAGNTTERSEARFFAGQPDTPAPGDVVVNEILYDPVNGSAGEYVEIVNTSATGVYDLRAITLDDGDGDGDPLADEAAVLLPGEILAVVRDAEGFQATFPDVAFVEAGTAIGLSNSGEALVLRAAGAVLDSVFYDPGWHRVELDDATGLSLERRDARGPSNARSNWSTSLAEAGGTPSAPNTLSAGGTPVERSASLSVAPSPFAPTRGEAARITVTLAAEAALVRARVYDGGGRAVRELEPGRLVGGSATLTWDGTGDDRRPLRAGLYVLLVEAVDAEGGTTEALRGVVVVARPEG